MKSEDLSKIKYIYRIYESSDCILHCEKYPVIYLNSEVVYFKDKRKGTFLNYVHTCNVKDDFVDYVVSKNYLCNSFIPTLNCYFWNVDTDVFDIFNEIKNKKKEYLETARKEEAISRYEKAKRDLENSMKLIKQLKIEISDLERVKDDLH